MSTSRIRRYGWSEISDAQNKAACKAIHAHVLANPTCAWCDNPKIAELTAHHIVPVHEAPDRCCDDTNLVTLCAKSCHLTVGHHNNWQRCNDLLPRQLALKGIK